MPTTLAGLLIFTALILPGFAFIATYTFDRPRRRLSTMETTTAIVTASLLAELAVAAGYSLARLTARGAPTVDTLVRQPGDHWTWVIGLLATSAVVAAAAAALLRWRRSVHPSVMSSWWVLFDRWPKGRPVQVQCELDDGSGVTGYLGDWNTMEDELPERDLTLVQPITVKPRGGYEYVPHLASAVCVSARHIVTMFVGYIDASLSSAPPVAAQAPAVEPAGAAASEAPTRAPGQDAATVHAPDRTTPSASPGVARG